MTRISYLEILLEELEEVSSLEEAKELIQSKLEEAYELNERRLMASSDSLFSNDDEDDDF